MHHEDVVQGALRQPSVVEANRQPVKIVRLKKRDMPLQADVCVSFLFVSLRKIFAMNLDPRTLILITIIGAFLMSGGLFTVTRGYLGEIPEL